MWIETVDEASATGRLQVLYGRVVGPDGHVDNIMRAHSLRPHTMEGHMALYKAVLHHTSNRVEKWLLETIGVHVSLLNRCAYCVEHHFAGLCRLLDEDRARAIRESLEAGKPEIALDPPAAAAVGYAEALTTQPAQMDAAAVDRLRAAGWDDGQILEINQVAAYFAYANRTVLGLGITTDGDTLGLSPSGEDWSHR